MHVVSQKGFFAPQNAVWGPKCSLAKRGQGDYTLFATAIEENDMSKMMFLSIIEKIESAKLKKLISASKCNVFVKFIIT